MILGFDIGGTKCAVIKAKADGENIELLDKRKIPTRLDIPPEEMIKSLISLANEMLDGEKAEKIGISCGGPLNSVTGTIEGPPNLPGWDNVRITDILKKHYKAPAKLMNDADACAVAEWKFGAGKGTQNMIFLTFGTGLGAGLILNGKLYFIGEMPSHVNGVKDELLKRLKAEKADLNAIKKEYGFANVTTDGKENKNIHYTKRVTDNGDRIYYLVNLSDEEQTVTVNTNEDNVYLYDVITEKATETDGKLTFAPYASFMLLAEYCKQNSGSNKYHGNINKTALRVFG